MFGVASHESTSVSKKEEEENSEIFFFERERGVRVRMNEVGGKSNSRIFQMIEALKRVKKRVGEMSKKWIVNKPFYSFVG